MLSQATLTTEIEPKPSTNFIWNKILSPIGYFVKQNKSWTFQVTTIALAGAGVVTYTAIERINEPPALLAAHAAGAAIKYVFFPTLMTPYVMSVLTTVWQNSIVRKVLNLENRFLTHKVFATFLATASIPHTIGQIYNNPSILITQEGLTGIGLLALIALPLGGAYFIARSDCVRKTRIPYDFIFKKPHQIGALAFLALYAVHTPADYRTAPYVGAVGGALLIDEVVKLINYTFETSIIKVKLFGDIAQIIITKPTKFMKHLPGQIVYIQIGNLLSPFHPFTIANSWQKQTLEVYIGRNGKWTSSLIDQISKGEFKVPMPVRIVGPLFSSLQSLEEKTKATFISTRTGLTPLLSILSHAAHNQTPTEMTIIHSSNNVYEFEPLTKSIDKAFKNEVKVTEAHYYFTNNDLVSKQNGMRVLKDNIESYGMKFVDVDDVIIDDVIKMEENISSVSESSVDIIIFNSQKVDTHANTNEFTDKFKQGDKKQNNMVPLFINNPGLTIGIKTDLAQREEVQAHREQKREPIIPIISSEAPQPIFFHRSLSSLELKIPCGDAQFNRERRNSIIPILRNEEAQSFKREEKNKEVDQSYNQKERADSIISIIPNEMNQSSNANVNTSENHVDVPVIYCHSKRFDPNRVAISKMKGSLFYCGNKKLGNTVEEICRELNKPLKRETFSF